MTISAAGKLEPPHPPLARDAMGNLLPLPDGIAAWRICRETTGRPNEIKGPDKQPFRFPLDTTSEELAEMCGCGVYRVYALDELGKQLVHVSTWDLTSGARELRNAIVESPLVSALRPTSSSMTDLRFALEAMTAMMRTNSDALRMVAESHVDLAKTIAAVKGLPRNAIAAPTPPAEPDEPDDDDEDDDEDEERPRHWVELMMPLAEKAAEIVPALVMGKVMQQTANDQIAPQQGISGDASLASKPNWELRDFVDLRYAAEKANAKKAAKLDAGPRPAPKQSLQSRVMADPKLMAQFIGIKSLLSTEEAAQLFALGQNLSEQEQEWLLAQIAGETPEKAAALLRGMLAELNEVKSPQ
jgi:hypothetical protein